MIFLGLVYLEGFHLYQGAVIHWQLAEPASNVSSAVSAEPSAIFLPHMLQHNIQYCLVLHMHYVERCEKGQNSKFQFTQADYLLRHIPDFRTVFEQRDTSLKKKSS